MHVIKKMMEDKKKLDHYITIFIHDKISDSNAMLEPLKPKKYEWWKWMELLNVPLHVIYCLEFLVKSGHKRL